VECPVMAGISYVNIILYLKIAGNFSSCVYIVINTRCTVALYPAPLPIRKPGQQLLRYNPDVHLTVFQPYTPIWWLIFPRSRYFGMTITHGE
jgi:hypothetical protein